MSEGHRRHDPEHAPLVVVADMSAMGRGPGFHAPGGGVLTPADVRNKVFTTVRLREGYDLAEVDTFLGQVEIALRGVLQENADLNARLAGTDARAGQPAPHSAGDSAARIVALAREAADREISRAQEEARRVVAGAYVQAEAVERQAVGRAEALERDVRDRHRAALESVESLQTAREDLSAVVREYGSRLVGSLEEQVRQVRNLLHELEGQADPGGQGGLSPAGSVSRTAPVPVPVTSASRAADATFSTANSRATAGVTVSPAGSTTSPVVPSATPAADSPASPARHADIGRHGGDMRPRGMS
ncbi:DivIVA domain-containing protein [Streptosporangium sp. NPDC006007]|uniref:DivIVA domain-containing protein n=1 Tax=Streptosporangium sp. NPDC006007 TaxID=3154575 RepID=UPI0033A03B00